MNGQPGIKRIFEESVQWGTERTKEINRKSNQEKQIVQEIKYTQSQKRTENIKKFLDINNVILV